MRYNKGTCSICNNDDVYIVKKLPTGNYCITCNEARLDLKRYKQGSEKPLKPIPKITPKQQEIKEEDVEFFKEIWNSRPHKSEVTGASLNYEFNPAMFFVFSHILTKKAYPKFRHNERNIMLMTLKEHHIWEFEKDTVKNDWFWQKVFKRRDELKQEYYKK